MDGRGHQGARRLRVFHGTGEMEGALALWGVRLSLSGHAWWLQSSRLSTHAYVWLTRKAVALGAVPGRPDGVSC